MTHWFSRRGEQGERGRSRDLPRHLVAAADPARHRDEGAVGRGEPQQAVVRARAAAGPAEGHHAQGGGAGRALDRGSPARWRTPCSSRCCRDGARPPSELPAYQTIANPPTVVVVPVRALGVRGGVRDGGGDGEPPHRARRGPVGGRGGLLAGPRRRALDVGRRGGGGRRHRGGAGDRALVAGARAGRGAGPAAGHGARAARRQGPGDRVQPALRRPGTRPGRRARGGAAAGGRGARRSGPRARRPARRGHRARRGRGARRRRRGRRRDGGGGGRRGRAARAAAGRGADGHPQPLRPRRRRVRPAGGGGRHRHGAGGGRGPRARRRAPRPRRPTPSRPR